MLRTKEDKRMEGNSPECSDYTFKSHLWFTTETQGLTKMSILIENFAHLTSKDSGFR